MEERWYRNVHISQQTGLALIRVRVLHGITCLNEQYHLHLTCYYVNMRESQLPSSNPRPLQPLPLLLLSRTLTSSTSIIAIKLLLYYVIPAPQARLRCSELQAYTFPCRLPSSWVALGIVNGALARCSLHTVMGECIRILASTCNPSSSFYSNFTVGCLQLDSISGASTSNQPKSAMKEFLPGCCTQPLALRPWQVVAGNLPSNFLSCSLAQLCSLSLSALVQPGLAVKSLQGDQTLTGTCAA